MLSDVLYYKNYSAPADVCAIVICLIYWILLNSTYTIKQKNLFVFKSATLLITLSATSSIFYHYLMEHIQAIYVIPIYILRNLLYISLILTFCIFCIYLKNLINLIGRGKRILDIAIWSAFGLFVLLEISSPLTKLGFYIDSGLNIHQNFYLDFFHFFYIYYFCIIAFLLFLYRKKFIAKTFQCIRNVMLLSGLVIVISSLHLQTSYLCISFTFPVLAVLFLFHHNSYDINLGTLDQYSFNAYIEELKNRKFSMICLYLEELNMKSAKKMSQSFIRFNEKYFKNSCMFRIRNDKFIIVYEDELNPDSERLFPILIEDFDRLYQEYKIDYKIVLIHSDIILQEGDDYLALDEFIEDQLPANSAYHCKNRDMEDYLKSAYILSELKDIHKNLNLDDPRVKVFCQPVLNTKHNVFNSAEALMRLHLKENGIVYPDLFIPLAEKHGYIHTLSKIILNKTCQQIREFEKKGYLINRISVNFSIVELKDKDFCKDVIHIIQKNHIEFHKIAIELTESRNEQDFEMVKAVMLQLQNLGIKFYLDDFGTGYSNFERITSLPIDIIKFDRSMTRLAGKNEASRALVGSFSDIFQKSNYQILFEGIEDEETENHCLKMNAAFLQGYKYSKPIPMEQLQNFLAKE